MPRGIPANSREQAMRDVESATKAIAKLRVVIASAYAQMAVEAKKLAKALKRLGSIGIH